MALMNYNAPRTGPEPIFTNEFEAPREAPVIKPVLKLGGTVYFMGRDCRIVGFEGQSNVLLAYTDNVGVIHTLAVKEGAL